MPRKFILKTFLCVGLDNKLYCAHTAPRCAHEADLETFKLDEASSNQPGLFEL